MIVSGSLNGSFFAAVPDVKLSHGTILSHKISISTEDPLSKVSIYIINPLMQTISTLCNHFRGVESTFDIFRIRERELTSIILSDNILELFERTYAAYILEAIRTCEHKSYL